MRLCDRADSHVPAERPVLTGEQKTQQSSLCAPATDLPALFLFARRLCAATSFLYRLKEFDYT
jgi:hypothetical protein